MESRKDFGMLDEADVQMVIKDNQTPAWTGAYDELPPAEFFNQVKKVLLVITAGQIYQQKNSTRHSITSEADYLKMHCFSIPLLTTQMRMLHL